METVQTRNALLDEATINRKLKRMALQVAEQNIDEKELVLAGINGNGEVVAQKLASELMQIHSFQIHTITIHIDKRSPLEVSLSNPVDIENKTVIIVDDVANTGRTMLYALKPFLNSYPKKIQTLVLVERSHKLFPVQTDYAGLSIATTLQEHIAVETKGEKITGAWLY